MAFFVVTSLIILFIYCYLLVFEFLNSSLFHCFIMIYDILSQLLSGRCQQYIYIL